ncbi:hypothetical protein APHAL10511_000769 [Amanita phalloides]|nr:hypothetical protein APHAL10511_000769 [Amanita phalloides]
MLSLNCFLLGCDSSEVFDVEILKTEKVSFLKDLIKQKQSPCLDHVATSKLTIWKVSLPVDAITPELTVDDIGGCQELHSVKRISLIFSDGEALEDEYVHILVQAPSIVRCPPQPIEEELPDLEKFQKGIYAPPPSSGAKFPAFKHEQEAQPIMNGHPMENHGLPVHLFNPAFSHFQRTLIDPNINLTADDYSRAYKYIHVSATLYKTEALRHDTISTCLSEGVCFGLIPVINTNGTKADGSIVTPTLDNYPARAGIYELKNEIGAGSSDPAIEGSLSYRKTWVSKTLAPICHACCCPSFILSIAGPWMCISGAVFIENVMVQKLTDYVWTGSNPYDDKELESIACLFKALSVGLQDLKIFYGNLSAAANDDPEIQRLFPFTHSYLDLSAVYLAATTSGHQLIVKFVQRYNSDVHRLLTSHDLALMLHYSSQDNTNSNTTGGPGVVIMDFVQGSDAYVLYLKTQLPNAIYDKVKQAISILHTESIVFGNLRLPNILITEKQTPMFIDFDWCGKHRIGRYPSSLNDLSSIGWHEGAVWNGIMYMEHDTFMLEAMQPGHSMDWSA